MKRYSKCHIKSMYENNVTVIRSPGPAVMEVVQISYTDLQVCRHVHTDVCGANRHISYTD